MSVGAMRWWGIGLGLAVVVHAGAQVRGGIVAAGIELHAMQISTMWTEHAHAIGRALDGTMDARVEMVRDREEARAVIAHTPGVGVCEGIEGFRGVSAARGREAAAAEDAGDALQAWLVADADELAGWTPPGELRERFDEVHARFCAEDRVRGGGGGCTGPDEEYLPQDSELATLPQGRSQFNSIPNFMRWLPLFTETASFSTHTLGLSLLRSGPTDPYRG